MGRAPCCDKAAVKRGPWSEEEDARLRSYVHQHGNGGSWIALPRKAGLRRCGKSCRLRWLNYLRPDIRHGGFSEEEDRVICGLYAAIGSRWSLIAAQLPGRTDNDVKNYWNTRLKKKLFGAVNNAAAGSNSSSLQPKGGHHYYVDHADNAALVNLSPPLLPSNNGQQEGTVGSSGDGGGLDMHVGVGDGDWGGRAMATNFSTDVVNHDYDAFAAGNPAQTAATELDEIFRSTSVYVPGGDHSALLDWYQFQNRYHGVQ